MKPIYLSIEGINSFVAAQEIDFSDAADANIFCICGPTGSGKTTILDSIILALYGKGDRGDTKDDYINLSCDKGTIVFRFELGGAEWEVKRILSRKAGGDKAYLTNVSENNDMVADGVEKVNAEMQKLIGLSAGDFTQVVILEQGKFGKFLTSKKTARNTTIAQLFSLDKFDGLSKKFNAVAEKFAAKENETTARAEHLKDLSHKAVAEKKTELKAAEKELGQTEKTLAKLEKEVSQIALLRQKFNDAVAAKASLDEQKRAREAENAVGKLLAAKRDKLTESEKASAEAQKSRDKAKDILSKSETVGQSKERISELEIKRAELRKKYAEKENSRKEVAEKIAKETAEKDKVRRELNSLFGGIGELDTAQLSARFDAKKTELNSAVTADGINIENLKKARVNLNGLRENFRVADEKIPAYKAKFESAENAEKEAERAYETARTESAALSVAATLKDGDSCPVCGGVYHSGKCGGAGKGSGKLSELKADYDAAKTAREKCAAELKTLCDNRDRLFKEMQDAEKSVKTALSEIKCTQDENEIPSAFARLKDGFAKVCKAAELISHIAASERNCEKFMRDEAEIKSETELILQTGKSYSEEIERRKEELKKLVGDDFESAEKAARETLEKSEKIIADCEKLRDELNRETQEHSANEARIAANIANAEKAVAAAGNIAFDEKAAEETENAKAAADKRKSELIAETVALKQFVSDGEKGLKDKEVLETERKYYEKRRETAESLAKILRGNKFLEYIEEEYIREFTSRASEKLFELSGGKFTLDYVEDDKKSDFWVSDHLRGGEKRKVRTLSGGETFLASLSMAIAISEQIAHNKSYDFFFLDEGFGTLDENAIDTVAAALYKLADETMVGLVSHRSELVEKIPSRIKVLPATEGAGSKLIIEKA